MFLKFGWRLAGAVACLAILLGCPRDAPQLEKGLVITDKPASHSNRLAREKSPYLLQHQHNPVDWFPWGEEAFAKARSENKPIFLSIGYSTCHWCHVMERESFESEEVAKFLNAHFVSIKVDREERPDVDKIYMTFVQGMTGQGGWPLNVFLAPDLKPFYGGTYWPPEPKFGRASFLQVLEQIHRAWTERRDQLTASSQELHRKLNELTTREATNQFVLSPDDLRRAGQELKRGYDPVHGGWGTAPKFPSPSHPSYLLRYGVRFGDKEAVNMVLHTCERMASGGIYDQIGGGFSRYSVDAQWLVPHFEKMLYDNAQLLGLFLDCFLVSGEHGYADVAHDIIRYLLRDMTHPEGGFYSAEDADSEGKEGKFYCWTRDELGKLLTPEEFNVAVKYYGISEKGNFVDHSDPDPLPNQNVLSVVDTNLPPADVPLLKSAKEKMMQARSKRVRPHLDDKVLASWNGLMLGALARAGVVLGEDKYLHAAEKNCAFLKSKLWDASSRTLYHRWRDGQRDNVQLLEAYAFLLSGVIDLYQCTLAPEHLAFAIDLGDAMLQRFYDPEDGGFWQTPTNTPDLILRVKEDYDGAEPSGNSVAALALLKLSALSGRTEYRAAAEKTLRLFSERLQKMPQAVPYMLMALDFSMEEPRRAVIAAHDPNSRDARELVRASHSVLQPRKVVLGTTGPVEPFAQTLKPKDARATAYVCTGTACQPPTHDAAKLRDLLK
ncbi:MAG: thioredoxin domain-containing protein [Verrucomicrobia subdivision 3 bacterium]|nr:thioredoxin domain-containing protein [Limisphaerales bacterium]